MRCVYCKLPSEGSKSVEHVVPESLGNRSLILPRGIVCDGCNNYFSRKVEGPFLNSPSIRLLRHEQGLTSKRGRVPRFRAFAPGVGDATMFAGPFGFERRIMFDTESSARLWLARGKSGGPMITEEVISPPSPATTSRFLAKVAIGCLADRLRDHPGGLDYLTDEPNLDALRDHARRGAVRDWPVSVRRIYPANAQWREGNELVQRIWELDMFQDEDGYQYSVLVLFGVEFVIHLGEPDISSYRQWFIRHGGESPLFVGPYSNERETYNGEAVIARRAQVGFVEQNAGPPGCGKF